MRIVTIICNVLSLARIYSRAVVDAVILITRIKFKG